MSSGRIQLATVGLQDEYLTGSPDVTYFIKKFNRHTKFALETLDISFNQTNIDFGSWINVIIPRNGQLIRTIYLKLVLPALTVGGYTNGIGNAIVEHADLVIGGQTIERITGEYMQIYDQTFISDSQQSAMTYMVGNTNGGLYGLGSATAYATNLQSPSYGFYPRTFIVPLPFYFMRNEALSIPICALTRSEVEIRIKLRPLSDVIAGGYVQSNVQTSVALNWGIPPNYGPTPPNLFALGPMNGVLVSNVVWLPSSSLFVCIPAPNNLPIALSTIYYYNFGTLLFVPFSSFSFGSFAGAITGVSQNTAGITIVVSTGSTLSNSATSPTPIYRIGISALGLLNNFSGVNDSDVSNPVNYITIDNNGTNFLAVGSNQVGGTYTLVSFSSPLFLATSTLITTTTKLVTVIWAPNLNAFIIGDVNGVMYTYKIGATAMNIIVGAVGPYSTYCPMYGQTFNISQLACSGSVISNCTATSFDGGVTWPGIVPYSTNTQLNPPVDFPAVSIAYSPTLDLFFTLIYNTATTLYNNYSIASTNSIGTLTYPTEIGIFKASLPVEYVFLADEEVNYIQNGKIDYVITQLQLASTTIPVSADSLDGYKLNFINPVKELYFLIQDSNVVPINDYWNYLNTTTGGYQMINLELQFNGEDIISPTVADALYLNRVQFMNNHTRVPDMSIYNYSFAIDPENYLPTGQVNMSRIMNQNLWINLTPNPNICNIRVYAVAYNILRVQNGLAGVLFIDNNFI